MFSRREVLRFTAAAVAAPGVLSTLGAPRAGADGLQLIDFATRLVSPKQIKAAGFDGALVYVSELRPGATFDSTPGFRWAWQTKAWSDGKRAPGAVDPGALIDGVSVDVDDVLAPDFGQWDLPR